jgi:hypothetical protein
LQSVCMATVVARGVRSRQSGGSQRVTLMASQ